MALSLACLARTSLTAQRRFSTEIPITQVARILRLNVKNEETAIKLDDIVRQDVQNLKKLPGFVKVNRSVCKAEWAYEVAVVFDSLDNLKGYMESEARKANVKELGARFRALGLDQSNCSWYVGNRVYDDNFE